MFDQKSWNNRLPLHERMALFVKEQPAPPDSTGEAKQEGKTTKQEESTSNNNCM